MGILFRKHRRMARDASGGGGGLVYPFGGVRFVTGRYTADRYASARFLTVEA